VAVGKSFTLSQEYLEASKYAVAEQNTQSAQQSFEPRIAAAYVGSGSLGAQKWRGRQRVDLLHLPNRMLVSRASKQLY
jgi:hypothetical protein